MKKRYTVKSVTKFVVFDTQKRVVIKGEYTSVQSADDKCQQMNRDEAVLAAFSKADGRLRV